MTARQPPRATALAAALFGLVCAPAPAQVACPCFDEQDVRSVYPGTILPREEIGRVACSAEDFDVEFMAEVATWDKGFKQVSHARARFFDYDTSDCLLQNELADPPVELEVEWPQPAPKDVARACYDIIVNVARELDSTDECYFYP